MINLAQFFCYTRALHHDRWRGQGSRIFFSYIAGALQLLFLFWLLFSPSYVWAHGEDSFGCLFASELLLLADALLFLGVFGVSERRDGILSAAGGNGLTSSQTIVALLLGPTSITLGWVVATSLAMVLFFAIGGFSVLTVVATQLMVCGLFLVLALGVVTLVLRPRLMGWSLGLFLLLVLVAGWVLVYGDRVFGLIFLRFRSVLVEILDGKFFVPIMSVAVPAVDSVNWGVFSLAWLMIVLTMVLLWWRAAILITHPPVRLLINPAAISPAQGIGLKGVSDSGWAAMSFPHTVIAWLSPLLPALIQEHRPAWAQRQVLSVLVVVSLAGPVLYAGLACTGYGKCLAESHYLSAVEFPHEYALGMFALTGSDGMKITRVLLLPTVFVLAAAFLLPSFRLRADAGSGQLIRFRAAGLRAWQVMVAYALGPGWFYWGLFGVLLECCIIVDLLTDLQQSRFMTSMSAEDRTKLILIVAMFCLLLAWSVWNDWRKSPYQQGR
jgi:hypothetical protein